MMTTVGIHCDAESHRGKVARIALFVYDHPEEPDGWLESDPFTAKRRRQLKERRRQLDADPSAPDPSTFKGKLARAAKPDRPGSRRVLDGDTPALSTGHRVSAKMRGTARATYEMRCDLCGDYLPAREEKLFRVLDLLRGAEVYSISMTALRARVR